MHRILELYSGIGGMHCAWQESSLMGEVIAAIDINNVANTVYNHNFPHIHILNKNIQSISSDDIKKLDVDTILMSPPCQPFTRNGKCLDKEDPRTDSFIYILNLLEGLTSVKYILLENVKGFECSEVRDLFIETLRKCGFTYQEYLLSPYSVGVPNSRLRYYCIARRDAYDWNTNRSDVLMTTLQNDFGEPFSIEDILEPEVEDTYFLSSKVLKWGKVLDICHRKSKRSCCFTKAYTHYYDGTGSVFTNASPEFINECYKEANKHVVGSEEYVHCLKPLELRFFSPEEVLRLMSFPKDYNFPKSTSIKQCYRLLGNSVNVKVISELIKILFLDVS